MNIPISKNPNHMIWTGTLKTAKCMMAGPGHNPPIPQPRPKEVAPNTNFQSTFAPCGLNRLCPRYENFLSY